MQPAFRYLSAAMLALASASSFSATVVYTTSASFLTRVAPGSYTETFTNLSTPSTSSASFSGGAFAYTASSPGDTYLSGGFLSTSLPGTMTLTFTSGNVTAVGGNFYASDYSGGFQALAVTLTLSDSTTVTFTPATLTDSYRGFVSTAPIASMTFSAPAAGYYASIDNLTVGAVPEPSTWLLMALGASGLLIAVRKRNNA